MLCPAGILETFIYDTRNGKVEIIYRDAIIPRKNRREELRRESIKVADAVRLAQSVAVHPNGNRYNLLPSLNPYILLPAMREYGEILRVFLNAGNSFGRRRKMILGQGCWGGNALRPFRRYWIGETP